MRGCARCLLQLGMRQNESDVGHSLSRILVVWMLPLRWCGAGAALCGLCACVLLTGIGVELGPVDDLGLRRENRSSDRRV